MEKSEQKSPAQHLILHTLLGRKSKMLLKYCNEKEKKITFFVTPFPSKQNKKNVHKNYSGKRPSHSIFS